MTKVEAEALRAKWKQQGLSRLQDRRACAHPNHELEWHEDGRLTRNYCCTHCGEIVGKTA
ncbi:MAG TPA: hypothetical protein VK598_06120 [Nitrospiraceae bacterium]|nr:hypothetical protein [Nitrospiraceae bacterium]